MFVCLHSDWVRCIGCLVITCRMSTNVPLHVLFTVCIQTVETVYATSLHDHRYRYSNNDPADFILHVAVCLFVFQGAAVGVCVLCWASRLQHQILRLSAAAEGKWSQSACWCLSVGRSVHISTSCESSTCESIILVSVSGFLHFPECQLTSQHEKSGEVGAAKFWVLLLLEVENIINFWGRQC